MSPRRTTPGEYVIAVGVCVGSDAVISILLVTIVPIYQPQYGRRTGQPIVNYRRTALMKALPKSSRKRCTNNARKALAPSTRVSLSGPSLCK